MMQTGRRVLFALAFGLLLPQAARADTPVAAITKLNDALQALMHAGKATPFETRVKTFQPVLEQVFDLPHILQASVGPRWSSFTDAQRAALLDAFIPFTVSNWVANFNSYAGQKFVIVPEERKAGTDVVVQTRIVPTAGEEARLDYVMQGSGTDWKVVDILYNGSISRVAVQRSDFRTLLTGSDPTALINSMRQKTQALAAGG